MKPYDRTLLEIFAAEQAEHVLGIRAVADVLAAEGPAAAAAGFDEALRRAHTLKGAARAVGLEPTEKIAHRVEALFLQSREQGSALAGPAVAAIHHGLDAIEDLLAAVLANRVEPDPGGVLRELDALLGAAPQEAGSPSAPPSPPPPAPPRSAPSSPPPLAELVRVSAANIDELIRASSQLLSTATGESLAATRADDYLRSADEALTEFRRLRRDCTPYLREHQDAPELAPLRECLEFADNRLRDLLGHAREAAAAQHQRTWELRQRSTELHQNAVRVRMTPAESVFGGFGAMVREIAHGEGKEVEFRFEGLDVQADRVVLQALKNPVMHLLRNAISHGIESPHDRTLAGKPAAGWIRLQIDARGDRLHVAVEDDGRGLDLQAVADEAVRRGLVSADELGALEREELASMIFRPGFSTSKAITSLSGRGMGLSVVERTVSQLQGEISVRPRDGGGLQISISAALSVSTNHVLLMAAGGHTFAVPARFVSRLLRLRPQEVETVDGREVAVLDAHPVPLARLVDLLALAGNSPAPPGGEHDDAHLSIVVLVFGEQTIGIIVDELVDDRSAVVKDLGLPEAMVGLSAGGISLEDGTVAILLNAAALWGQFQERGEAPGIRKAQEQTAKLAPSILIVDDSITTRSLEKSILEAHGYRVRVAVDGLEALQQLNAEPVDLVITDVTMPRMDGLQLLQEMKKQKNTEHIPVIIVTSLERREDQERGLSLGADAYIVKRKFDQRELLNTVRQIL